MSRPRLVFLVRDGLGQPARCYHAGRNRRDAYREARRLCRKGYIGGAVSVAILPGTTTADPCAPGADLSALVIVAQWVRIKDAGGYPRAIGGEL